MKIYLLSCHEFENNKHVSSSIMKVGCTNYDTIEKFRLEMVKRNPDNVYAITSIDLCESMEEVEEIMWPKVEPTIIKCPDDMPDEYFRKLGDW